LQVGHRAAVGRIRWLMREPRRRERQELERDLEAVGKQIASQNCTENR